MVSNLRHGLDVKLAFVAVLSACSHAPAPPPTNTPPPPTKLELTWIVHPVDQSLVNDQDYPLAPLDLQLGRDVIKLKPQMGALNATYQSVCHVEKDHPYAYPLLDDEVAKIAFAEGGAGGYLVKRESGRLVLFEWSQGHGLCENAVTKEAEECPVHTVKARELDAPANAQVVQRLIVVDAAGTRSPIDCSKPFANTPD